MYLEGLYFVSAILQLQNLSLSLYCNLLTVAEHGRGLLAIMLRSQGPAGTPCHN